MMLPSILDHAHVIKDFFILPPLEIREVKRGKYMVTFRENANPNRDCIFVKFIDKTNDWDLLYQKVAKCFSSYFPIKDDAETVVLLKTKSISNLLQIKSKVVKNLPFPELRNQVFLMQTENFPIKNRELLRNVISLFDFKNGELFNKDDATLTGFAPSDIHWAIEFANKNKSSSTHVKKSYKYWYNTAGEPICIVHKLGQGGFCKVYSYIDLESNTIGAFKSARSNEIERMTLQDLNNEFELLEYIHSKGKAWGIQVKPKKQINLEITKRPNQLDRIKPKIGFVGVKYHCNYLIEILKNTKPPIEEILFEFHQLLGGLKILWELDITHGDLKLRNILVGNFKSFKWVHIGDLGGARRADCDFPLHSYVAGEGRASSFETLIESDLRRSIRFLSIQNKEALVENEKIRDVLGMGCIMHFRLTGEHPLMYTEDICDSPPNPKEFHGLDVQGRLPELSELILRMINHNCEIRPSAEMAFNTINQIIRTKFPALGEIIDSLMKENHYKPL